MSPWTKLRNTVHGLRDRLRGGTGCTADVERAHVHLGTEYGGYAVLPELVHAGSVVYSFGIGEDVSFDMGLIERFGCTVHGFDPTPRSVQWVKSQDLPSQFVMHAVGLADYDGIASFEPPKNPAHISHRIVAGSGAPPGTETAAAAQRIEFPVKHLSTIMHELGHTRLDLLKMDIESAEYSVIDALVASDLRPPQLLVEFHHRMQGIPAERTCRAIQQLRAAGYQVFDVQPSGRELSFVHL